MDWRLMEQTETEGNVTGLQPLSSGLSSRAPRRRTHRRNLLPEDELQS